jgi:hypothetical protein
LVVLLLLLLLRVLMVGGGGGDGLETGGGGRAAKLAGKLLGLGTGRETRRRGESARRESGRTHSRGLWSCLLPFLWAAC